LEPDRPTLLVTGASQGSASLNALLAALLSERAADFAGWQIIHLAGDRPEAIESSRQACADAGIPAIVEPFTSRMGLAWGAADLAMSRAGASSVAEAMANAVPTVFLPYPYHADQHQRRHVEPYVEAGLAWVVVDAVAPERNLPVAGRLIRELLRRADVLAETRGRLVDRSPPDAASAITQRLLALLSTSR
jgi:UDP-N-acetylglucosamine--N-acetylmuramyl-(pentapeptide) pyrophosphoryl-undecaprenol N-acetylglucosamine transferase